MRGALRRDRVRTFMKIALPNALRSTLDLAQVQIVAVFSGWIGSVEAGTHNTLVQLYAVFGGSWAFAVCDGIAIRVGFHLGNGAKFCDGAMHPSDSACPNLPACSAGDIASAQRTSAIAAAACVAMGAVVYVCVVVFRAHLGKIFSHDPRVVHQSAIVAPVMGGAFPVRGKQRFPHAVIPPVCDPRVAS